MKRAVAALIGCAAICAACSTQPQAPPPLQPVPPAPAAPGQPTHPAVPVGQSLDLMRIGGQSIKVTLTEIVNPAVVPNGWGDPTKNYIATKLRIENTGSTTIVGNTNSDVTVIGSDNHDYRADFATVVQCKDFVYGWFLIAAGSSTAGCVVFALPPGVSPAKIRYVPSSGLSHDVGEWRTS